MSSLLEYRLDGTHDIVAEAIKRIRGMAMGERHICLRFSGGKDSIVVRRLCELAGVSFDIQFSRTSVDPPELLQYIRQCHADVAMIPPRQSMFQMIVRKGFPPTRVCRYCCAEYKERNTCPMNAATITTTGVRRQESPKRKRRQMYEQCLLAPGVNFFHPIIDWTEDQIWDFIKLERLPYCTLYDEDFDRIGCVGCPLASSAHIHREFRRWPNFERAYLWAFERMLEGRQFDKWKSKFDVMDWYIYGVQKRYEQLEGQYNLFSGDYYEQFADEWDTHTVAAARDLLLA